MKLALRQKFPVGSIVMHKRAVDPGPPKRPQTAVVTGYGTYEYEVIGDIHLDVPGAEVLLEVEYSCTCKGRLYHEYDMWAESEVIHLDGPLN